MTVDRIVGILRNKQLLREQMVARRAQQTDHEELSRRVFQRLVTLPAYAAAKTVMMYLDIRSEVRTRWFVPEAWNAGKKVVVPYCDQIELRLFCLQSFDDLAPGTLGVLEPKKELVYCHDRWAAPEELDLIVAPGLAFDRHGGRLGYGKGYYDRLLHRTRPDATRAGVCFECQLVPEIPLMPHDIRMNLLITEDAVYDVRKAAPKPSSSH